jgi:uncharacterized membrane protein YgdD (TMEM256/DUF423 family)
MSANRWLSVSAVLLGLAVALGAFGAHGLEKVLTVKQLATWQTAVFYHFVHSLALLVLSLAALVKPALAFRGIKAGLLIGLVLFSGSLYAWVLSGWSGLVFVTPIGGTIWLGVWLGLAYQAWRFARND